MKKIQPMPQTLEHTVSRERLGNVAILLNNKDTKIFHVDTAAGSGCVVRVWPWRIEIENDLGTYEFARHLDMMEFFRDERLGAWVNGVLDQDIPEALRVMANVKFTSNQPAFANHLREHSEMPNRHYVRACAQLVKAVQAFDNQVMFQCLSGRTPKSSRSASMGM